MAGEFVTRTSRFRGNRQLVGGKDERGESALRAGGKPPVRVRSGVFHPRTEFGDAFRVGLAGDTVAAITMEITRKRLGMEQDYTGLWRTDDINVIEDD